MCFNGCCRQYCRSIPKATLKHHLDSKNVKANEATKPLSRTTTLPPEAEKKLTSHNLKLEELLFGLKITEVRKLPY